MAWLAAFALVAALGLAACGGGGDTSSASTTVPSSSKAGDGTAQGAGLVAAYCLYRSDTKAQALACDARTDPAQVHSADDDAARWARGEMQTCGSDAGKLCEELSAAIVESSVGRRAP